VNEVVLDGPESSFDTISSVRRAGRADFTVLRGGASLSFSVIGRD